MITPLSPALPTRAEIHRRLMADPALAELVSARVYPGKLPNKRVFPFILVSLPLGVPSQYDASDGGSDLNGRVQCYTAPTAALPDAEAAAANINAHVVRVLMDTEVVIDGAYLSIVPTIDQVLHDGEEADRWQGVVNYNASVT